MMWRVPRLPLAGLALVAVLAASCTGRSATSLSPEAPDALHALPPTATEPSPPAAAPKGALERAVVDPADTGATDSPPPPPVEAAPPVPTDTPQAQPAASPFVVLVRGHGAMPAQTVERLAALPGVRAVVPVLSGQVWLTGSRDDAGAVVDAPAPGFALPLDVIGVRPAEHAVLLPADLAGPLATLRPGEALLGTTSARLRGLGPGAAIDVAGTTLRVTGIVDDAAVGAAEVVVDAATGQALGLGQARFALVATDGDPAALRAAVADAVAGVPQVIARDFGHSPWPTSWREMLAQALLKERFGEFAVRPGSARSATLEPGWADANIIRATVPILGDVTCHRAAVGPLMSVLTEVEAAGLAHLLDPGDYAGCFSPRLTGPGGMVSRHAWGLAVDVNAAANPFGAPSRQDPRLVEIFKRHGFAWGGDWPRPDAMHFEYRGEP